MTVEGLGSFHDRLGQRRMRVNNHREIFRGCAHFHRNDAFTDQFAGTVKGSVLTIDNSFISPATARAAASFVAPQPSASIGRES